MIIDGDDEKNTNRQYDKDTLTYTDYTHREHKQQGKKKQELRLDNKTIKKIKGVTL